MQTVIAFVVGILVMSAVYLMLSKHLMKFLFGLILISNAANLIIFSAGRLTSSEPPLIPVGADLPSATVANALPQALVLTAIVIGFGLFAFSLVLVFKAYHKLGTLDSDNMRLAEPKFAAAPKDNIEKETVS